MKADIESKTTKLKLRLMDFVFGKSHGCSTEYVRSSSSGFLKSYAECERASWGAIGIRNYVRARIGAYLSSKEYNKKS